MITAELLPPYLSDAEVDEMCDGLVQDAAKIRYLRGLGLRVDRKPNGRPLVWRPAQGGPESQEQNGSQDATSVVVGLQQWASKKKAARNGSKA